MKKDFKSIAFLAVFTMIVGCAFYCIGFYDSAVFTLLVGLTMLAIYHAGLYNRGIIEDNTIESQKEIIERDKNLIDYLQGHIGFYGAQNETYMRVGGLLRPESPLFIGGLGGLGCEGCTKRNVYIGLHLVYI